MPHNFEDIARGESWSVEFTIQNATEEPDDLTGRDICFIIRDRGVLRARLVSSGTSEGGSMQVTPAQGRVIVTVEPDVTAALTTADWALWLDETEDTADAVAWGRFRTVKVATSDA